MDLMQPYLFECYELDPGGLEYAIGHSAEYINYASHIEPDRSDTSQVWERIAFAILTANCQFKSSVAGLQYARTCKGRVQGHVLTRVGGGMTQAKAGWLNSLPPMLELLKQARETWTDYRRRLARVRGLGITKASFAACLLYPFEADICCLDVWMLRGLVESVPRRLTQYEHIEERVRAYARECDMPLFLMQWALWDWLRGSVTSHDIFTRGIDER